MPERVTKREVVNRLLAGRPQTPGNRANAFAPANIALGKYWGKRDAELNLPLSSSLSVSLGRLGTQTEITPLNGHDEVFLNGEPVPADDTFARRSSEFLDLFRPPGTGFRVRTQNSLPTAAGLASSASGFAALALALDELFGWGLTPRELSILARLGSGSACRSVCEGFVLWHAGERKDGLDSFAEALPERWPELRLGLLEINAAAKPLDSRTAMARTVATSALYEAWPVQAQRDLAALRRAIAAKDFEQLGQAAENNALAMHGAMLGARPPILYWQPATVEAIHQVWQLRAEGQKVYLTIDAGPNLVLLFLEGDAEILSRSFPQLEVVTPFFAGSA